MTKIYILQTAHNIHIGPLWSETPFLAIGPGLTIGRKGGGIRERSHAIRVCRCVIEALYAVDADVITRGI